MARGVKVSLWTRRYSWSIFEKAISTQSSQTIVSAQTILQPHHLSTLTIIQAPAGTPSSGSLSRLPFPALHQASGLDAPLVPSTSHVPQLSVCLSPLL